jgi:3-deoxy-D-manno-octulosonic-acid transferase
MARPALWLYSALAWASQPLLRRKLRRRARAEPGYAKAVGERFGRYQPSLDSLSPQSTSDLLSRFVWVHAVSLGETRAAAILIDALRRELPGMRLLLTHGTATGRAEGEKLLQPGDVQVWLPWDTPGAVRRFLRQFRPVVGILMETEVWPNLVAACRQRGVPLVLANARLNARSLHRAQRMRWLAKPAYGALAAVWAQTEADAERLHALGAPVQGVLGNLKFDLVPDAELLARGRDWRTRQLRPVVMLASSREGEEVLWLEALKPKQAEVLASQEPLAIKNGVADASSLASGVQWLVVPRHPQRFDEVQRLLQEAGLRVSRRSSWQAGPPQDVDVWLGDTLGEMPLYYGLSDVVLLGGSFAPLGGQNLIEAAACACPVVLGPHTFNFAEASELACASGAGLRVADMAEGVERATMLAGDAAALEQARARAEGFAQSHRGAAKATARAVRQLLQRG